MKKISIITLIFVLTATLFAGCRNGNSTNPTTVAPGTSSSTRPTVMPMPEIPMPSGTNTTAPGAGSTPGGTNGGTDGTGGTNGGTGGTTMPGRIVRPSARGPRY